MRMYKIYQSYSEYFIFNDKTSVLKKELEDFDYVGYFEVDTNDICCMQVQKIPSDEFLELVNKIQSMDFAGDSQVRINRTKLRYDWEEHGND